MKKVGRNDPCPCGSGKKYKKCCLSKGRQVQYTQQERDSALAGLYLYIERTLGRDDDEAFEEFWGKFEDHPDVLEDHQEGLSEHVYDLWYAFDRPMDDGRLVVDLFIEEKGSEFHAGERTFLLTLRDSSMRLYEIEDALPGESLTLRDVIEGGRVTVRERLGSKSLNRHDWIAARVISRASGRPEIEGLLPIPVFYRDRLYNQIRAMREDYLRDNPREPLDLFYKDMPPIFHEVWVGSILDPYVPQLANTDGEEMVLTRVLFDILDRGALIDALRSAEGVTHDEEKGEDAAWKWCGKNAKGNDTLFGSINLAERRSAAGNPLRRAREAWQKPHRVHCRRRCLFPHRHS